MLFQLPYGGSSLQEVFYYLEYWGISDVILPFILIFTLIYAILIKIGIFGGKEGQGNRFNGVIALAIALMAVIPHVLGKYPPGMDIIVIINTALPEVVLLLVAVVMLLIMTGLIWGEPAEKSAWAGIIATVSGLILVGIFLSAITPVPIISQLDPALKSLIIAILVFALVFWYVTKPESKQSKGLKGLREFFGELYKKGS